MNSASLILFDLDHTLFNTRQLFQEWFHPQFQRLTGHTVEATYTQLNKYWQHLQSPRDFSWVGYKQFVEKKLHIPHEKVEAITGNAAAYQAAVYPEVLPIFAELQNRGYLIGIWSEGDPEFQQLKLSLSGLQTYCDENNCHISRWKTAPEVLEGLPAATVVDDRMEKLQALTSDEMLPIWLNRAEVERPPEWTGLPMVKNLEELLSFL